MANLKRYNVTINGHKTIMQLTEAKAKEMGGTPYEPPPPTPRPEEQAAVIAGLETELEDAQAEIERLTAELTAKDGEGNDAATPKADTGAEEAPKAAAAPVNKSRAARNKAR